MTVLRSCCTLADRSSRPRACSAHRPMAQQPGSAASSYERGVEAYLAGNVRQPSRSSPRPSAKTPVIRGRSIFAHSASCVRASESKRGPTCSSARPRGPRAGRLSCRRIARTGPTCPAAVARRVPLACRNRHRRDGAGEQRRRNLPPHRHRRSRLATKSGGPARSIGAASLAGRVGPRVRPPTGDLRHVDRPDSPISNAPAAASFVEPSTTTAAKPVADPFADDEPAQPADGKIKSGQLIGILGRARCSSRRPVQSFDALREKIPAVRCPA